jgi:diguanylate cyclase (GGDEF)-like protein
MLARARIFVSSAKWLAALWLLTAAGLAHAGEVQLRDAFTEASPPAALTTPAGAQAEWTWLKLRDPHLLQALPEGWQLLVDQVRFQDIAVIATAADGSTQRIVLGADQLQANWAPGGVLKFDIATPGREIRDLAIGFHRIDDVSLMRKVTAATPERAAVLGARWLVLMGVFAGLLLSAFVYNLFVTADRRSAFQRWYLGWVASSLAYGLVWSNLAAFVFPGLAGPMAVRVDTMLVGLTVALGSLFLVAVLERGKVPPRLRQVVRTLAAAAGAMGVLAADERLLPARLTDIGLNLAMLSCVGASIATIVFAAVRRSRVVWLFVLGWSPVIAVFLVRVARNFALVEQSDFVDHATFAAVAFESLVFSLVIADRFLTIKRERDAAAANARGMEIEQETLRRAAHSDFLTGLGNRASFHEVMRELFARPAGTRKTDFTLFLIDVDFLKELNDRQGHDAGDALLQYIGTQLDALESRHTRCARIGGDEFAVLCEGVPGEEERVAEALDRLQGALWMRHAWSGVLSLSVGTASSRSALSPADLFQQADIALYEAKRLGRGRQQAFDKRLRQRIQSKLDLIKDAHWGLQRSEFLLHFQPIVELSSGRHVSVEALLRWQHPVHGLLTPESFACVLADEEVGAAVQQRVLALAIDELQRRPEMEGTLSINVTAVDLHGASSAHRLLRKLFGAGVSPSSLCVEVTEGTLLGKAGEPAAALHVLHEAGVRIALDDFGTGYASLVHLKEIPVDTLKIDRSFTAGLLRDGDESEEIVRAVLALGHGLNKTVIAEGVETLEQLARLRELGCDYAQGYLFGRPAPAFDLGATFQVAA